MTRIAAASVLALVCLMSGCGGSSTPAQTPSPTPAPAPATDPAPAAASAPAAKGSDGWEGEGEAKGTAAPAAAPESKPVPSGSKQPEETRTVEVITKVIKGHRAEIRQQCYEPARKDLPSLQGDMVIHLVIDPAGKVKTAELNLERSTLKA